MEKENTVLFKDIINRIQKCSGINDQLLIKYFESCFDDLSQRFIKNDEDENINRVVLSSYLNLPLFISNRIFKLFIIEKRANMTKDCFVEGMIYFYFGSLETLEQIFLNMLDFSEQDTINYEDVLLFMSYLNNSSDGQMVENIEKYVDQFFNGNKSLSSFDVHNTIKKCNSDLFVLFFTLLYQKQPFSKEDIEFFKDHESMMNWRITVNKYRTFNYFQKQIESICPLTKEFEKLLKYNFMITNRVKKRFGSTNILNYDKLDLNVNFDFDNKNLEQSDLKSSLNDDTNKNEDTVKNSHLISFIKETSSINNNGYIDNNIIVSNYNGKVFSFPDESKNDVISNEKNLSNGDIHNILLPNKKNYFEMDLLKLNPNKSIMEYKVIVIEKNIFSFGYNKSLKKYNLECVQSLNGFYATECETIKVKGKILYPFALILNYSCSMANLNNIFLCSTKNQMEDNLYFLKKKMNIKEFKGNYELSTVELGNGQYGSVFLGTKTNTSEKVAIKMINKNNIKEKDHNLIKNEIDIMNYLKFLNHPNVIKTHDIIEDNNFIFIIMEYAESGTLQNHLRKTKNILPPNEFKLIAKQIAEGLNFIAKNGIIHRDLKPDNILVSTDGPNIILKISDFGLSKVLASSEKTNESFGTIMFTAPEVLKDEFYDKKVDIWSFGILLYYLRYGIYPFDANKLTKQILVNKICSEEIKFPKLPNISKNKFEKLLISNCLKKIPYNRNNICDIINSQCLTESY